MSWSIKNDPIPEQPKGSIWPGIIIIVVGTSIGIPFLHFLQWVAQ